MGHLRNTPAAAGLATCYGQLEKTAKTEIGLRSPQATATLPIYSRLNLNQ